MQHLVRLLSWRYLTGSYSQKAISTMAAISFFGIFIGTFALALILCIMNGFEKITTQKLQSIHAPILMSSFGKSLNIEHIETVLNKEFGHDLMWAPRTTNHVIIHDEDGDISNVTMIKGIDPKKEICVSNIGTMIEKHTDSELKKLLQNNQVIIGYKLAQQLGIDLNDTIELLYPPETIESTQMTLESVSVTVCALLKTGIEEFDAYLILSSLDF